MAVGVAASRARWLDSLGDWVESPRVQRAVTAVILLNAVTLGLETSHTVMAFAGEWLHVLDRMIVAVFVAEIGAKLLARGLRFFRDGWNWFDFLVVGITLLPATGNLSVLRTLRILRALRLISVVPRLRAIVEALLHSVPGLGAIAGLLLLIFYVGGVMATKLFGADFPDWFGTLGRSMYSLFQIMTLESWSMGIVRPVMELYPYAWMFFVPFILVATFTMLNLFIAIIVNSLQHLHAQEQAEISKMVHEVEDVAHGERAALAEQLAELRNEIQALRRELGQRRAD